VRFGGGPDEGFKLDVYGDWSRDFGDDNGDGLADAQGGNIRVTGGEGAYTITFDDRTRRYTVAKQ
jgi:hypothetical protein